MKYYEAPIKPEEVIGKEKISFISKIKKPKVKLENIDCILTEKLKDKKFKKTYDKVAKGLKEAEEGKGKLLEIGKGKTYESVDAMLNDMHKDWNILDYLESYWHRYFWNYVSEIPLKIKSFIQRGIRGWADEDTWCFDYYLAKVISEGVEHLRDNANSAWTTKDLRGFKEIIKTFETAKEILENKKRYIPSDEFTWKEYKRAKRFYSFMSKKYHEEYKVMTLRDAKRFEKGFELFRKNYFGLWD